jgi:hypothetical protein
LKHLISNRKAIGTVLGVVMIMVIAFACIGTVLYANGHGWFNGTGTNNQNNNIFGGNPSQAPTGDQSVNKPLKLVMTNIYGGGALTGTSSVVQVYLADGVTKTGSALSLSSSSCTTTLSYPSGTHLVVGYAYSTTDFMFWNVVVPTMSQADATSLTVNTISLQGFNSPAITESATHSNGTAITTTQVMNVTTSPTGSITNSWYVSAANTGFLTSHDAIYNTDNKAVFWTVVSGTGYTSITLSGFDGKITRGTTDYYYKVIDPQTISSYKVGNNYVLPGTGSFTFGYTAIGYTGSAATIQNYIELYSDPAYLQSYGTYGPYSSSPVGLLIHVDA